jgi:hypothetical protein
VWCFELRVVVQQQGGPFTAMYFSFSRAWFYHVLFIILCFVIVIEDITALRSLVDIMLSLTTHFLGGNLCCFSHGAMHL